MADLQRAWVARAWAGLSLLIAALLAVILSTFGTVAVGAPGAFGAAGEGTAAEPKGRPRLDEPAVPVRIQLPDLGIDLPVVSSERNVPGNERDYPLCDVAQYWTIYDLPGAPGTTWIYAHAQPGMFLPIFLTANATAGSGLLGKTVLVQLRDGRLLRYRIDEVRQHALNRRIARLDRPGQQRLVLQTSEGPPGTVPKLQVAAQLVGASWTDERPPTPRPRACWQPRVAVANRNGGDGRNGRPRDQAAEASLDPALAASTTTGGPMDGTTLVLGGGAVLLGAILVAAYLVRRPPASQRPRPHQRRA